MTVYFIRPVGMDGPIKIGTSIMAHERLRELMTWSPVPLEIAVEISGHHELERALHSCFADAHSHREWFHPSPRLVALVEALIRGVPVEQAIDLSAAVGSIHSKKCLAAKARKSVAA